MIHWPTTVKKDWIRGAGYTLLLLIIWVVVNRDLVSAGSMIVNGLFFSLLYLLFFTYARPNTVAFLQDYYNQRKSRRLIFPSLLLFLYYLYGIVNDQPIFEGVMLLIPFLVYFPTLMVTALDSNGAEVRRLDFFTLILFLFPITLVDLPMKSNLPLEGISFESVFRLMMMLSVIHGFVVLRGLKEVGFYPEWSWKKLGTTIWVWLLYIAVIFAVGFALHFIQYVGYEHVNWIYLEKLMTKSIKIFFHTAILEELFFRGLLQNMLTKQLNKNFQHQKYWIVSSVVMMVLSVWTGYGMDGNWQWFPAFISLLILGFAYLLSLRFPSLQATYLGLAIASIVFGLVHFHSGSILFVGFASVAGWAYGYVFFKTQSVYYAALIHTLVNSSTFWFGLELMK